MHATQAAGTPVYLLQTQTELELEKGVPEQELNDDIFGSDIQPGDFPQRFKVFVRDKITAKTDQWQAYHKEVYCIAPQRFAQGKVFFAGRCPANFNIWHDALLTRRDDVQL